MKGQIFNLFESFISEKINEDIYEQALELAKPELENEGIYVGPGTYSDNDFFNIVKHALKITKIPIESALIAFGEYCFPRLFQKLPSEMQKIETPREFLTKLNSTIHVEVRKVNPGAEPPYFETEEIIDGQLLLRYKSKRKLFAFVEGMLVGLCKHYGYRLVVEKKIIQTDPIGICEYYLTMEK